MTETRTPAPIAPPHQLTMVFDSKRLRGLSAAERRAVLTALAHLLAQAAIPGGGDDER